MSDDLDKMLAEEAEHAEEHKDAEPGPDTKISRPNRARSHVFSVRLNDAEMKQLAAIAARAAVPPSTMARSLITQQLSESITRYNRQIAEQLAAPIVEAQRRISAEMMKTAQAAMQPSIQAVMQAAAPSIQAAMQAAAQPTIQAATRGFQEEAQKMLRQHGQEIQDIIRRATKA